MKLKHKRPVVVPTEYREELAGCSKAALMDLVWSLATYPLTAEAADRFAMAVIRGRGDVINHYRRHAQ